MARIAPVTCDKEEGTTNQRPAKLQVSDVIQYIEGHRNSCKTTRDTETSTSNLKGWDY